MVGGGSVENCRASKIKSDKNAVRRATERASEKRSAGAASMIVCICPLFFLSRPISYIMQESARVACGIRSGLLDLHLERHHATSTYRKPRKLQTACSLDSGSTTGNKLIIN